MGPVLNHLVGRMITKDTPIKHYLIAVDAPEGTVFTVYGEDPVNRNRFELDPAWVLTPDDRHPADRVEKAPDK